MKQRLALECHLDYMIKYLELHPEGRLPKQFKDAVLQKVRSTMTWMRQSLSSQEVIAKIDEMSAFMQQALQQHGLLT